jgi:Tfp pilus assembly protein PilP
MKNIKLFLIIMAIVVGSMPRAGAQSTAAKNGKAAPSATANTVLAPTPMPAQPEGDLNYKYEVRGRRDPFRSLDVASTFQTTQAPIVRPPGLKGQMVSEIRLVGIVQAPSGMLAMAQGYKDRSFLLRPNDILYDGKILEIRKDAVVISQTLKDTEGKTLTQQVVKKLQPTRGEGR